MKNLLMAYPTPRWSVRSWKRFPPLLDPLGDSDRSPRSLPPRPLPLLADSGDRISNGLALAPRPDPVGDRTSSGRDGLCLRCWFSLLILGLLSWASSSSSLLASNVRLLSLSLALLYSWSSFSIWNIRTGLSRFFRPNFTELADFWVILAKCLQFLFWNLQFDTKIPE